MQPASAGVTGEEPGGLAAGPGLSRQRARGRGILGWRPRVGIGPFGA